MDIEADMKMEPCYNAAFPESERVWMARVDECVVRSPHLAAGADFGWHQAFGVSRVWEGRR